MSNEEQTDKEINDRLDAVFPNPVTKAAVATMVASKRPVGWGRKSNAPYYKKDYAEEIRPCIDAQIETQKDFIYRYETYCKALNISQGTLYNRVNQGIRFLCDKLDPTGKYRDWFDHVDIDAKSNKVGIIFSITKNTRGKNIQPEFIEPRISLPKWRQELDEWLESDSNEPFNKEGIILEPYTLKALREEFCKLKGIMADIRVNKIMIVKA